MKKYASFLLLLLINWGIQAQKVSSPTLFVSDYTGDNRLNTGDSLIVYLQDIFEDIDNEEWDRSLIDLSINDISLEEITPVRFSRVVKQNGTEPMELLAFVLMDDLVPEEKLDRLREIKSRPTAFVSIKLPNDAVISETVKIIALDAASRVFFGQVSRMHLAIAIVVIITFFFFVLALGKGLVKDESTVTVPAERPFSYAKTQIFWWTLIVLCSVFFIWISTNDFSLNATAWILLGISGGTLGISNTIDRREMNNGLPRHQDDESKGWLNDILQNQDGIVSIHRLQSLLFNVGFGLFYLITAFNKLELPTFDNDIYVLLGLSNGAYTFLKNSENNGDAAGGGNNN